MQLPIEHISYSAMRQLVSNPWLFKKNYILGIFDYKQSPAAMVGKAFHRYVEQIYKETKPRKALEVAHKEIDRHQDKDVKWGKTGSREKCRKELARVIGFWEEERDNPLLQGEVKSVEHRKVVTPTIDDKKLPLPVKAITDLVLERKGKLHLIDWKVVSSHTDTKEEKPEYIMQAVFNSFTVKESLDEPVDMTFVEIKKSANKNGDPQVNYYTIEFQKHPEYFKYWSKMYVGLIKTLSNPDYQFMPNFSDHFSGAEAWTDFTTELMDFDVPKQVSHKPKTLRNVEQSQYRESLLDTGADSPDTPEGKIAAKLIEFGIPFKFEQKHEGANVTMYEFLPSRGVRMSAVEKHDKDLMLALETKSVRILAPIPGKKRVGIEVANKKQQIVNLSDAPETTELTIPVGVDVYGHAHTINIAKAPHLLIAGATGSGKSVAMASIIKTLSKQNSSNDLGLVLIDPKRSEFVDFRYDSHLLNPIITEIEDVIETLKWAVEEMEKRYQLLEKAGSRNIEEYNDHMQRIIIIIDELADLMLSKKGSEDIENYIVRIAQKARAVGIHLIIATQRPSVNVVTGILKANFPTRIAFMVATKVDSSVIIDSPGAEKLMGNGDLLLMQPKFDIVRLQGYYDR